MHPTPKARLGDDHHNGAGGEAKSEPLGPTCSGGLTPPSQADPRPDRTRRVEKARSGGYGHA